MKHSLILDVGTTSVKAFIFDDRFRQIAKAGAPYPIRSPKRGWVEQSPMDILHASIEVMRHALKDGDIAAKKISGLGMTNQRETTIVWDTKTGKPIYPAIVWQDMRTASRCRARQKHGAIVSKKTGLALDPYFSATKIEWILDHVPHARMLADCGRLRFGTVDTWLMWNLCEYAPHVTDMTNASRTLLMDISKREWDADMLALFNIPLSILPNIKPSQSNFGTLKADVVGENIPVVAVCGDQQSSHYATYALTKGTSAIAKITYGTGVFVSQSIGQTFALRPPYFTTLIPDDKRGSAFALEGKVCVSGPDVEKRLKKPEELRRYFYGLAKKVDAYIKRLPVKPKKLIIDGGSSRDGLILSIQEEVSGIPTEPLIQYDGTALGTALLAAGHSDHSIRSRA